MYICIFLWVYKRSRELFPRCARPRESEGTVDGILINVPEEDAANAAFSNGRRVGVAL